MPGGGISTEFMSISFNMFLPGKFCLVKVVFGEYPQNIRRNIRKKLIFTPEKLHVSMLFSGSLRPEVYMKCSEISGECGSWKCSEFVASFLYNLQDNVQMKDQQNDIS